MKTFIAVILYLIGYGLITFGLTGCGLLHKNEPAAPTLRMNSPKKACEIARLEDIIDYKKATETKLNETIDCLERNVDKAFDKIKGSQTEELAYEEIRLLNDKGILQLNFSSETKWEFFREIFPIFHPQGKFSVSRAQAKEFLAVARKAVPLYLRGLRHFAKPWEPGDTRPEWLTEESTLAAVESVLHLISPKWRLTFSRAQHLTDLFYDLAEEMKVEMRDSKEDLRGRVEAAWILKSIVFADEKQGVLGDITGSSVRALLDVGLSAVRKSPLTISWLWKSALAKDIPSELPKEWETTSQIFIDYFTRNHFAIITTGKLTEALQLIDNRSTLHKLSHELVRLSQRLSPPETSNKGFHPIGFPRVLEIAPKVAADWVESAKVFPKCTKFKCTVELRDAMKEPALAPVALKGDISYPHNTSGETPFETPRLSGELTWAEAMNRHFMRRVITELFSTFDPDNVHKGQIPLKGSDSDLEEAVDIAYTFLRFASISTTKKNDDGKEEEPVQNFISIKPGAMYKIMGLVGDRWMLDGDKNDKLNADEFFSIVQIYNRITHVSSNNFHGRETYMPWNCISGLFPRTMCGWGERVFGRRDFITGVTSQVYPYHQLPWMRRDLRELPESIVHSFFHALIGNGEQKPIQVYDSIKLQPSAVTIYHYVSEDAALAPTAILYMLDRLMVACDNNEDNYLSWKELDCAMPLVLEAANQTIRSNLIDLDPDAEIKAKILLALLNKELPLSVSKLIAVNASIKQINLNSDYPALMKWADEEMSVSYEDLAGFLGGKGDIGLWIFEAKKRYGHCDVNADKQLKGKAEFDCFTKRVIDDVATSVAKLAGIPMGAAGKLLELLQADPLILGIKLATQKEETLTKLFEMKIPLYSSTKKIIMLLEETIRRAPENALQPSDFEPNQ